ncbi:hypothetical protein V2J09_002735 [Rumex salicifolius]
MDSETGPTWPHKSQQFDMNGKIMLGAVISLSVVIILVLILHIYARCAMTRRHGGGATVHHLPLQHRHVDLHQPNNAGLEPEVIASLPLFVIVKDQRGGSDCAVCLSDLEEGEEARRLPNCKHRFHVECIDRWLSNQSNCPICRTEVTPWAVVDEVAAVGPPVEEEGSTKELNGSSSSRLSSFRRIISGDWSSRRIQQIGVHDRFLI